MIVDIRSYPGSRKFPHFNKAALERSLPEAGIHYMHLPELGGRRKPKPDSSNTIWKNEAFRGYADYLETEAFKEGILKLTEVAALERTAYMCSEAVWWRCHRALVSDDLKSKGWTVRHILKKGSTTEHPYTSPFLATHPS